MAARLTVTVRQVLEDGSEAAVDGELAAALADSAEQFSGLLTWAAEESWDLDHGEREEAIMREGRELERRLLQATFRLDAALEERARRSRAPRESGTGPWRPGRNEAWPASSAPCGSPGWPTGTGTRRTCTRPMPGR